MISACLCIPLYSKWSIFHQQVEQRKYSALLAGWRGTKKFVKNLVEDSFLMDLKFFPSIHSIRVNFIICHVWRNATEIGFPGGFSSLSSESFSKLCRLCKLPAENGKYIESSPFVLSSIVWMSLRMGAEGALPHTKLYVFNLRRWKCLLNYFRVFARKTRKFTAMWNKTGEWRSKIEQHGAGWWFSDVKVFTVNGKVLYEGIRLA